MGSSLSGGPADSATEKKLKKKAAEEADKLLRNQDKSSNAARLYYAAADEAMDCAERWIACAAPLVAHLAAVFRAHHELLAASVSFANARCDSASSWAFEACIEKSPSPGGQCWWWW